jgi:hypothetical protein
MSDILFKDESGKAKQTIKPKTWTYVKFQGKDTFKVSADGTWEWTVVLRVEYPRRAGTVLRGRFCRFPNTPKLDETGHDDKNTSGWSGKTYHSHWTHTIKSNSRMPVGFWVWHDGKAPIVLDGRQIKAKKIA